jgi:acyl-coenzyme A synthetase/AMP-(fatty) acid ligase
MVFAIDEAGRRDSIALIDGDGGGSWTYGELAQEVRRRSELLQSTEKRLLFLFCRNDRNSAAWFLAAIEGGHAVALLNDRLEPALRDNLISLYRPDRVWCPSLESGDYEASGSEGLWRRKAGEAERLHPDLALLLSTSGSTGSPKMVRLTAGNLLANAGSIRESLGITPEDIPIAHLPLHYSYGLSVLNSHLVAGAAIVLTSAGLMSAHFWETIRAHGVNSFSGVPYTYQMLRRLGLEKVNVPSLRTMTQAGGKLDVANIAHFHEALSRRNGAFRVMYGQTEATARIAILPASALPEKLGSVGLPVPGGRFAIRTDAGVETREPNVEGELVYEGPNVMLGYALERGDLAKGDELHGRLYTGDRARFDGEGYLYILGRAKRDVKLFGLRLNLDELEALVKLHGPAAAVPGPDRVVFFCEFGNTESHTALRDALSTKLSIHRSAFEFRSVAKLPVKDSGKIDYERLQAHI